LPHKLKRINLESLQGSALRALRW